MDSFQAFELSSKKAASALTKRQQPVLAIPTTYLGLNAGPKPALLVGIVLGSIVGFLLIMYLIYAIANFGGGFLNRRRTVVEETIVQHKGSSPGRRRRRVYEEDVFAERSSSRRTGRQTRTHETTRGPVEADVCISPATAPTSTDSRIGYLTSVISNICLV